MITEATNKQVGFIHGLLTKMGMLDMKADLAKQYSNNRTDSTKHLTRQEAQSLISNLLGTAEPEKKAPNSAMHRKILSIAHEMRWELGGGKVNMEHLNNWLLQYSAEKVKFNDYPEEKLPALITQMEIIRNKFLEDLKNEI